MCVCVCVCVFRVLVNFSVCCFCTGALDFSLDFNNALVAFGRQIDYRNIHVPIMITRLGRLVIFYHEQLIFDLFSRISSVVRYYKFQKVISIAYVG